MQGHCDGSGHIKVLFVWPYGYETKYLLPLSFAFLKSNLPADEYRVELADCSLNNKRATSEWLGERMLAFQPDVVCVSSWSIVYPEALAVLRVAKKLLPGVITIMGGPHVTTSADEVIRHAAVDFVIKGEAEFSFQLLLKTLGDGCGNFNDVPGLVFKSAEGVTSIPVQIAQEIDHVRPPDYGFIDLEEYWKRGYRLNSRHAKNAPLWVTRGCPYKCSFCSAPNLNGRPVRVHSVAFMRVWILHLYHQFGVRWFNIIDDNFTFNVEYAKEFCRMVKGLGLDIKFGTPNGIRVQRGDVELWRLMKDAGWETVIVAPESGSKKSLLKMRKD